jgi:hypothetical protein
MPNTQRTYVASTDLRNSQDEEAWRWAQMFLTPSISLSLIIIIISETPWVESIQHVQFTFTIKHEKHANPTSLSLHGCCNVQTALYPTTFLVIPRYIECLTVVRGVM